MNIGALLAIAMPQPSTGAKTLGSGFASPIVPAGIDDVVAPCGNLLLSTLGASPGQPAALHFSSGVKPNEESLSFSDELIAAILSNLRVPVPIDVSSSAPAPGEAMTSPICGATITTSQPATGSSWPGLETPVPTFRFTANAEAFLAVAPPSPSDTEVQPPIPVPTPRSANLFSVAVPVALSGSDDRTLPKVVAFGPTPRPAEPPPPWVPTDLPEPTTPPRTEAAATPSEEFVTHEPTAQSLRMDLAAPKPTVSRPSGPLGPQVTPETPIALPDDAQALTSLIRASADQIKAVRIDVARPADEPVPTPDTQLPSEPTVPNLTVRESIQPTTQASAEGRPTLPKSTAGPTIPDPARAEQAEPLQASKSDLSRQAVPQDDQQDLRDKSVLSGAEANNPADVAQFTLDSSPTDRPATLDRAVDRLAFGLGKSDTPDVSDPLVTTPHKAPATTQQTLSPKVLESSTHVAEVNMDSAQGNTQYSPKLALPGDEPASKVQDAKNPITPSPERPAGVDGTHPAKLVTSALGEGPRSKTVFADPSEHPETMTATPEVPKSGAANHSAKRPEPVAFTPEVTGRGTTHKVAEHPERVTATSQGAKQSATHGSAGEGDAQTSPPFELKLTAEESSPLDQPETISTSDKTDVTEVVAAVGPRKQVDAPQRAERSPLASADADNVARPLVNTRQAHLRDRIEMLAAAKASEAVTLVIDPKGLGEIRVTLTQREGAVEAHAASPDERVREVLASSHQDLQRQFDQRGLRLERFTVDSGLADSSSRGYNSDSARGHQGQTPPRPQFAGVRPETSQPVHRRVPTGALDLAI